MNDVYLSIHKVASILGVTPQTLRQWDANGYFVPSQRRGNGYRYYTKEQVEQFAEQFNTIKNKNRINIGYCRVSTNKQKDDLSRQVENVELYLKSLKTPYQIIKDIGSGINYNKKGLTELLELICKNKVDTVYVLYKDRLVRFGFEILQKVAELHNTQIVVLDNEDKTKEQELVEDLMQIITVFSCRLHGKRAAKTKQLMKDLVEDDVNESTEG
jgi:predicted site-specific integrase-resolvase